MADVQHKDIPDAELHEPKGAAGASVGTVYVSNGAGSGSWQSVLRDFSAMQVQRVLDGLSPLAAQNPAGTGEANSAQITFGPAVNGASDPVQLGADGSLTVNTGGLYRVKITLVYGRTGGAGSSELRFRALVNGVQAGQTIGTKIDDADTNVVYSDEAWLQLPANTVITYELMRDSSGSDSGGLLQPAVTAGTAPNWNATTCAAIRVERWQ